MQSTRRSFLSQSLLALFASVPGFRLCAAEKQKFPGWNPGELDLHFIYTGCGENCFFRLPDGTAVLNDVGEFHRAQPQAARRRTNETGGDVASAAGAVHVVEGVGDGFPEGKRTRVACCSMCPPEEILPHCIHSSAPFGVAGRLTRAL